MPTARQKRVAKLIIENTKLDKPLNGGEIVENSGYGVSMKTNPQVILNSEGVKEALAEQGFTEDSAKRVVESIMLNEDTEPNARLKATDQVFKVLGSYAPEKSLVGHISFNGEKEQHSKDLIKELLEGDTSDTE
jgi:hypothetical protein